MSSPYSQMLRLCSISLPCSNLFHVGAFGVQLRQAIDNILREVETIEVIKHAHVALPRASTSCLNNVPSIIEHLFFRAPIVGAVSCIAKR